MASSERDGWFDEPNCQSCHTGTATAHAGAIRLTDALLENGTLREPVDPRFATTPDVPADGYSLYRFSHGHGDLACSACHGSPHAVYPTAERNDNVLAMDLQGHVGTVADCQTCHQGGVESAAGGPHGMHTIGDWWIRAHGEFAEGARVNDCRQCHGSSDRGSALSRAQGPRKFDADDFGMVEFWEGQTVTCYDCHQGPDSESPNPNSRPVASDERVATLGGVAVVSRLMADYSDDQPLSFRIVLPPREGKLSLEGDTVVYTPREGFVGTDFATFCAFDGEMESNRAVVQWTVGEAAGLDTDRDGLTDLAERALGTDPNRTQLGRIAEAWTQFGISGSVLCVRADLRWVPPDLEVRVEFSEDLEQWRPSETSWSREEDFRGQSVLTTAFSSLDAAPRFVRVVVDSSIQ